VRILCQAGHSLGRTVVACMSGTEHHRSSFRARALAALKDRFADRTRGLETLISECERLREVCDDYLSCIETIQRFEGESEVARERVREYSELKADLEQELRAMIESESVCRSCGKGHRSMAGQSGG
jgi:hypothetical protein